MSGSVGTVYSGPTVHPYRTPGEGPKPPPREPVWVRLLFALGLLLGPLAVVAVNYGAYRLSMALGICGCEVVLTLIPSLIGYVAAFGGIGCAPDHRFRSWSWRRRWFAAMWGPLFWLSRLLRFLLGLLWQALCWIARGDQEGEEEET